MSDSFYLFKTNTNHIYPIPSKQNKIIAVACINNYFASAGDDSTIQVYDINNLQKPLYFIKLGDRRSHIHHCIPSA